MERKDWGRGGVAFGCGRLVIRITQGTWEDMRSRREKYNDSLSLPKSPLQTPSVTYILTLLANLGIDGKKAKSKSF